MTVGYYAIPPSPSPGRGPQRSLPWSVCHTCYTTTPGYTVVLPIADTANPQIVCRACKAKLRAWR